MINPNPHVAKSSSFRKFSCDTPSRLNSILIPSSSSLFTKYLHLLDIVDAEEESLREPFISYEDEFANKSLDDDSLENDVGISLSE